MLLLLLSISYFFFDTAKSLSGIAVQQHSYTIDHNLLHVCGHAPFVVAHTHTHTHTQLCTFRLTNDCPPVGAARNTVSVSSMRQRQMSEYAWRATHQMQQQIKASNFFLYLQRLRLFEIEEIISGATVHRPRRPMSAWVVVFIFVFVVVVRIPCGCCPLPCGWSSSWSDMRRLLSDYSDFTFICMSTNGSAGQRQWNFNFEENLITFMYI